MRKNLPLKDSVSLQFELWQECNNKCNFCYLGQENRLTPDDTKIASLNDAIEKISDLSIYDKYNCLGYIGGEFFQGQLKNPEVKERFYELMDKTAELYNNDVIKQVWISATLTIGYQEDLYNILSKFKDWDGIWIVTSWDLIGRFKTPKMLENWEYHVLNLQKTFPGLCVNVTTILTGQLIDAYLENRVSFKEMISKYNISFFFKQPGCFVPCPSNLESLSKAKPLCNEIIPDFFPSRHKFVKFLTKFKSEESEEMWTRLFNIQYRADNLVRSFNDDHREFHTRFKGTKTEVDDEDVIACGHPVVYSVYIDKGCCMCDKIRITNLLG